jgi:hypothetical protein
VILSEQYAIELLRIDRALGRHASKAETQPAPGPLDAVGVVADQTATLGPRNLS